MNRVVRPFAVALLCALVAGSSAAQEDPAVLSLNPFKVGTSGWKVTGSEKCFTWVEDEATLVLKGAGGKPVPSMVYQRRAWDAFEVTLRAKKFSSKLRLVLEPDGGGTATVIEVPRKAVSGADKWCDLALAVGGGRAVLRGGEEEAASVELKDGVRYRFGFEAPSGASASVTDVRLVRRYANPAQVCEEGFESLFDGANLAPWAPLKAEMNSRFTVADGLLLMEERTEDAAILLLGDRRPSEYELRFRTHWGSTGLALRAVEVAGLGGQINRMQSANLDLTPHMEPDDLTDFVVRVKDLTCTLTANGKEVFSQPVGAYETTPVAFIVVKGKKAMVRDVRFRDLSQASDGAEGK